ncbi:MAG: DUF6455 family protein [Hyphomicrobiaceae bacterium]
MPKWSMFRRVWRRAELFERMADLLEVNLAAGARLDDGDAIRVANANCLHCLSASECRSWIEASDGLPLPPSFCRNREFFSRCAADKADPASRWTSETDI